MNRSYRHVWSKAQGRFVVAAETASSQGHGTRSATRAIRGAGLAAASLALSTLPALAQIVPTGGKTEVYRAPNGVQVVNINTANQAGLSHNKYLDYNVEKTGVVLNNGNRSQMARTSVLAGQVMANLNLAAEAKVILNEVVASKRSILQGYTEVLGGKADVIVANPYGITCSGCGFINTDRALLTTGLPQIGSAGTLDGMRVLQGDILVDGAGLDATGPRLLDLVARSIKIDGRLAGTDVGITTGANDFTWATRQASAIAGNGAAPSFAFDSTALGGMYVNRIRIVATEAGVGVRMLGEVAATGDDFSLDAAGRITLNNRISAERDAIVRQTVQAGADAISITGAQTSISAKRDVKVASAAGGITVAEALLAGERDLTVSAQTLDNLGTLQGHDAVSVTTHGLLNNTAQGKILAEAAGAQLALQAGSVHNAGSVQSKGSLSVDAAGALTQVASGSLATVAQADGGSSGPLTLSAAQIDNSGTASSAGLLDMTAITSLDNRAGGKLLGDAFLLSGGAITNHGGAVMQWKKFGTVNVASLTNAATDASILGSMDSDDAGTVYTSTFTVAGTLDNAGTLYSRGKGTVSAARLYNRLGARIAAMNDLALTALQGNGARESLRNEGLLYAGRDLSLTAAAGTLINAGVTAHIKADRNLTATARDIVNQYLVEAQNITLTGTNSVTNQPAGGLPSIYLDEVPVSQTGDGRILFQDYNCNLFGAACDTHSVYERSVTLRERLSAPLPAVKAQILAAQTLTITFGSGGGANQAGILSASTLNLIGQNGGGFTNQDFHLDEITYAYRRTSVEIDCTFCSADYTDHFPVNETQFNSLPGNNGDAITWGAGGAWSLSGPGYRQERVRTTWSTSGAGIFANTLNYSGGALRNYSSPKVLSGQSVTSPGLVSGPSLQLPPPGFFVVKQDPAAKFLVETDPLFAKGTDFVGSDFLVKRLGVNPETTQKRLGDAAYEAKLIREQLIAQTGRNLLNQKESEAQQMERLMSNAASAASSMGLSYGKEPTAAQLANLTSDIVWMVEKVVGGQKVLAPVVYLAQSTRLAFEGGGATIDVADANIKATTLENTGGTIAGSGSLNITTQGDITNTSGTIKGGNVALKSTEGSIVNKTEATTRGDDYVARTDIGKTAGIQATGSLSMDAKKDITVLGAKVDAGKDASLSAGGNVTFDTIVDKTANSKASNLDLGVLHNSSSNKTVTTERHIGSSLNVGSNLSIKSGGDTTIAGSQAKVGGSLDVDAGGDFNVLARQDTTSTKTSSTVRGIGVGGGLAGSSTTTTSTFDGKNVGSTLEVGGNAKVKAGDTMTLQGSDMKVKGNADIAAKNGIEVLDGLDEHHTSTHTETTTFMKLGGSSAAEANAQAKNGSGRSASAGASAKASGSLKLAETTTTDTASGSRSSVASNLQVGGNLNMQTDGTLKVQGSNVEAGGNLNADAKNIEVLAGRNETYSSAHTESKSIGIYSDAGAEAGAKANQTGANATASAKAEAKGTTTYGVRSETADASDYSLKNTASTLKSGGAMNLNAKEEAKFVGADVQAGGDLSIKAKDITSLAAQDVQHSSSSSDTKTAGIYVGAQAGAQAKAGNGGASASAGAEVSAGLRYAQDSSSETSGSVKQQTSSFKSGGNITRTAEGTITDQGTQMEAGGDIKQSATTIKEIAAEDKTYSSSNATSHDARIGVYAGAEAGADSSTGKSGADASAGFKASYEGSTESASESSTTAVTSRYKAGGSIDSTSKDKTTLIGTQFEAGKDVNLSAGSLDYQAARDTSTSSSSSLSGAAEVKVGVVGTAGVNGSVELDANKAGSSSSTARAGGINAGGGVNIKTTGDASFEGTNMNAGKGVNVEAGGNVDFKAARSTSESSEAGVSLAVSGGTSGSGKSRESEGGMGLGVTAGASSSNTAQASTINGGAGGVTIKAGNNASLEGTQVKAGGDVAVTAGGKVETKEAKSSSSSYGISAGVSVGGSSGGEGGKSTAGGGIGLGVEGSSSKSSQGVNIQSGGSTKVQGGVAVKAPAAVKAPVAVKAPAAVKTTAAIKKSAVEGAIAPKP